MSKSFTIRRLQRNLENCSQCDSLCSSRRRVVPGYGDLNANVMFVGLCPGRNGADLTGVPFTRDRSGVLFQTVLHKLNLIKKVSERPQIRHAYVTNIVKCCPRDTFGRNRNPGHEEIASCKKYVQNEIEIIDPTFVVTLGKIATECILGKKIQRLSDHILKPVTSKRSIVIPFYHPSYVIRGTYSSESYFHDVKSLAALIGSEYPSIRF